MKKHICKQCGFIDDGTIKFHGKLCSNCRKNQRNKHYKKNSVTLIKKQKEYYQNNVEKVKLKKRIYYTDNKEMILQNHKEYERKRLKQDMVYKLRKNIPNLIRQSLKKRGLNKFGKTILKYLPYSIQELKEHLENQFDSWMSWNNWGVYNKNTWNDSDQTTWTWQIDHVVPQTNLPYISMEDDNFKKCWALNNLRPLNAKQNLLDGASRSRHSK